MKIEGSIPSRPTKIAVYINMNSLPEKDEGQFKFERVLAEQKSKILEDGEVVDLLLNGDDRDLASVVKWYGEGIPVGASPVARFAEITEKCFDGLDKTLKEKYLRNAAGFILAGYKWDTHDLPAKMSLEFRGWLASRPLTHNVPGEQQKHVVLNIESLLAKSLELSGGDVQKARRIFDISPTPHRQRRNQQVDVVLHGFYGSGAIADPESGISERINEALKRNPKIAELAFWAAVDRGSLGSRSSSSSSSALGQLLIDVYPKADLAIKIQIWQFLSEEMLHRRVTSLKMREVRTLIFRTQKAYGDIKKDTPDSPFVTAFDKVRGAISLAELLEKTKGGKIAVDDLVEFLERNPSFSAYVLAAELENALDKTKDHGIALRIERLIREKKKYKERDLSSD